MKVLEQPWRPIGRCSVRLPRMAALGNAPESLRLLREALGGQGMDLHADADFARLAGDPAYQLFVRPKG